MPAKIRGGGYGLDAELAAKAAAKYNPELGKGAHGLQGWEGVQQVQRALYGAATSILHALPHP